MPEAGGCQQVGRQDTRWTDKGLHFCTQQHTTWPHDDKKHTQTQEGSVTYLFIYTRHDVCVSSLSEYGWVVSGTCVTTIYKIK